MFLSDVKVVNYRRSCILYRSEIRYLDFGLFPLALVIHQGLSNVSFSGAA